MIVLRKMWLLIPIFFSKRQRFGAVLVYAEPLLVFSCDQSGERRNTLRRTEVTRGHTHSTPGERVNVGCFYVIQLLIYANVGVSLVIGKITMMMGHFGPLVISLSFVWGFSWQANRPKSKEIAIKLYLYAYFLSIISRSDAECCRNYLYLFWKSKDKKHASRCFKLIWL